MEFKFQNVNDAFKELVAGIYDTSIPTVQVGSRAGGVLKIVEPVIITYEKPWERVLFNPARDANPFFHLFESLWMLAGKNDVATLKKYNGKIGEIASDDGITFNGAYGYRWRVGVVDQLDMIVAHLENNPESRRAVLSMWNKGNDLLMIDKSKDVCCNLCACFSITASPNEVAGSDFKVLNMTVMNRSNDLIWGALGANVVHFSFLQEYLAAKLGVGIGLYHQITNNLHVYNDVWEPWKWLEVYENRTAHSPMLDYGDKTRRLIPLYDGELFERELRPFVNSLTVETDYRKDWDSKFIKEVAFPMRKAFDCHKARDYLRALSWCALIQSNDWEVACTSWIKVREKNWINRNEKKPN